MNQTLERHDDKYGDSKFLAYHDIAINDFRKSEKDSKIQIIKKMLELRHNMKYNKHLLSVYLKAKSLFDNMVDEHRSQITYLEEIYHHINNMIRDNHSNRKSRMMSELLKDKKRIGILLKKMRNSYEKLTNVYTVLDVTVQKMNEMIVSLEEADAEDNVELESDDEEGQDDEGDHEEYIVEEESDDDEDEGEEDEGEEDEGEEDEGEEDEGEEDEDEDEEDEDEEDEDEDEIQLNIKTDFGDDDDDDDADDETTDPQEQFIMVF
jgi:hypothetical protein